ncbi:hypothetical protein BDV34DRAFT_190972 [Aspergillus parasiticus]|uniref:Uncharacterized protein n=1 Tax=Aspergillus parasiticus TaxID=5067 RepID=A0A5N6DUZ5_ASPPA|nr:hypothetical protein BDV34DRAFT_190972 [Aspergillus parasiticus]
MAVPNLIGRIRMCAGLGARARRSRSVAWISIVCFGVITVEVDMAICLATIVGLQAKGGERDILVYPEALLPFGTEAPANNNSGPYLDCTHIWPSTCCGLYVRIWLSSGFGCRFASAIRPSGNIMRH